MRKNKTLLRIFETELGSQTFKRKENIAFVVTIVIVILHLVGRGTTRRHRLESQILRRCVLTRYDSKACSKVQRKVRKKGFWWSYSFSFPRADCNIWANIYYRAVRIFGHRSYNKKFCRSSCIKTHGDPGRTITP